VAVREQLDYELYRSLRTQRRRSPKLKRLTLSQDQVDQLLDSPDPDTLQGLRDRALMGLLLCTGLRPMEIARLHVDDLRQSLKGELALRVSPGYGCRERLIPYDSLVWVLDLVQAWLDTASIQDGAVFRGFYPDNKTIRPTGITSRTVENILSHYPLAEGDEPPMTVKPADLRQTYACHLLREGLSTKDLQLRLGLHTWEAINDAKSRCSKAPDFSSFGSPKTTVARTVLGREP
jgi:integrase/recombinase XerD